MKSLILALSLALFVGCEAESAVPPLPPSREIPKEQAQDPGRTLEAYRVGTTTFAEFERDAGLIETNFNRFAGLPKTNGLARPEFALLRSTGTNTSYVVREGGPWRLYGQTNFNFSLSSAPWSSRRITVGDTHKPMYTLTFIFPKGVLTEKTAVTNWVSDEAQIVTLRISRSVVKPEEFADTNAITLFRNIAASLALNVSGPLPGAPGHPEVSRFTAQARDNTSLGYYAHLDVGITPDAIRFFAEADTLPQAENIATLFATELNRLGVQYTKTNWTGRVLNYRN